MGGPGGRPGKEAPNEAREVAIVCVFVCVCVGRSDPPFSSYDIMAYYTIDTIHSCQ